MAKYVIDIPDERESRYIFSSDGKGLQLTIPVSFGEHDTTAYFTDLSLSPYTEPNNKDNAMWMDGYEKGVKAGRDDAWEFVMKCLKMDGNDFYEIFGSCDALCLTNLSYQEAKAKYEAWKESKDEIRVGDEIRIKTSYSADAVVIGMDDYDLFIVWKDGETDRIEPPERKQWVKTGKHFPEVEELLKKITGESNED